MIDLRNRVALVTGGSRGIGAASAIILARAGAHVAITYNSNFGAARKIVDRIDGMGRSAVALKLDVGNYTECSRIARSTHRIFGRIDILVNSAGVWKGARLAQLDEELWESTLRINVGGTYGMCRAVLPYMMKRRYGRIINISSTAGQRGESSFSNYAAAKGAVNAFTKSIAVELIREGIWVNAIAPGWVETDMIAGVSKDRVKRRAIEESIPRGKIASADEIAGVVLFLASSLSNHIVGEIISVNGGSVLCG